jgi:Fe-S-cluster-containing dehydrogenase component
MKKWNLVIDVAQCENCNNCLLATRDELVGNDFPGYSAPHSSQGGDVLSIRRKVRGATPMVDVSYMPVLCNHCDDAPCIRAAGDDSIRKRDDGIVLIDPVRAKGRRDLVDACPYGAIVWNEKEQLPQNWFFDAHLLDQGESVPRCVPVCPTSAIEAVKLTDGEMATRVSREQLKTLRPELQTRPRVYYRNLDRFDTCFIGGTVSSLHDGILECAGDAQVRLLKNSKDIAATRSDEFGDFRFEGLAPDSGHYQIIVSQDGFGAAHAIAELGTESIYLGDLVLQPVDERARDTVFDIAKKR